MNENGAMTRETEYGTSQGPLRTDFVQKLRTVRDSLTEGLVEREVAVRLGLLASLAGEHMLMLGPPGTAKSLPVSDPRLVPVRSPRYPVGMPSGDPLAPLRKKVSKLKAQARFRWVDRFEMSRVTDGFDEYGVDIRVVVRSGITDVFENAERLDDLADRIGRIFSAESELYPYVTFVSADELAA